jgi:TATA-box binding protein (TBP) (component of TFIID and TFIIIB)
MTSSTSIQTVRPRDDLIQSIGIANNVATGRLRHPLSLPVLKRVLAGMGAEYSPRHKFPSLTLHFARDAGGPRASVSIFKRRIVCTGCSTLFGFILTIRRLVRFIHAACPEAELECIRNHNVVGFAWLTKYIDVYALTTFLNQEQRDGDECFQPALIDDSDFPGMRWHDVRNDIHYLVFKTGSIVITKGRDSAAIMRATTRIIALLRRCPGALVTPPTATGPAAVATTSSALPTKRQRVV